MKKQNIKIIQKLNELLFNLKLDGWTFGEIEKNLSFKKGTIAKLKYGKEELTMAHLKIIYSLTFLDGAPE